MFPFAPETYVYETYDSIELVMSRLKEITDNKFDKDENKETKGFYGSISNNRFKIRRNFYRPDFFNRNLFYPIFIGDFYKHFDRTIINISVYINPLAQIFAIFWFLLLISSIILVFFEVIGGWYNFPLFIFLALVLQMSIREPLRELDNKYTKSLSILNENSFNGELIFKPTNNI